MNASVFFHLASNKLNVCIDGTYLLSCEKVEIATAGDGSRHLRVTSGSSTFEFDNQGKREIQTQPQPATPEKISADIRRYFEIEEHGCD